MKTMKSESFHIIYFVAPIDVIHFCHFPLFHFPGYGSRLSLLARGNVILFLFLRVKVSASLTFLSKYVDGAHVMVGFTTGGSPRHQKTDELLRVGMTAMVTVKLFFFSLDLLSPFLCYYR